MRNITDRYANNVKRANLDGTDVEVLVENTSYPVDWTIDFEVTVHGIKISSD